MHIVLRSRLARKEWSFLNPNKKSQLESYLLRFSKSKGVHLISFANVGNHLHLHVKVPNRTLYRAWIRGLCSGIAMLILERSGFQKLAKSKQKFWDLRPFSRLIQNPKAFHHLKSYLEINQLESLGLPKIWARAIVNSARSIILSKRALRI